MNRMLSTAVGSAWKRASLSSPSVATAAAMAAAAILSAGSDDKGRDPKDLKKHLFEERASSWRNTQLCTCESLRVPSYGRRNTMLMLKSTSSKATLESRYNVDWKNPLGEGGFGAVYLCTDRDTGEKRALKEIPKQFTDEDAFQREMDALLRVRDSGSHPNICRLKENFEQRGNYYLVLDLVSGGEMFDHLAANGAYSEADAARLVKETASALAFIHGVGLVHADLKPENLMLSTPNKTDSVIKLVDFGCSEIYKGSNIDKKQYRPNVANTPAYCPPEAFTSYLGPVQPSFDMFSMGVILYIMLTGFHPFDTDGTSTDEEIMERIKKEAPPLRGSPFTAHLSDSAIDLLEKLLNKSPRRRMTAMQMLDHPWVNGRTAKKTKIEDSDKKLSNFRKFKSRLEVSVFADWVSGATGNHGKDKQGLIERAFKALDTNEKGYVTAKDLSKNLTRKGEKPSEEGNTDEALSLSGFSDLISDNMMNKYFPEGYKVYKEGSKGDAIYFINSGTVEVSTKAGFKTTLDAGQLFGEGALLDAKGRRNATITCLTPVHVIRISKEYFEKYMKGGGTDMHLSLKEQDRARDRDRAVKILRLSKNLMPRTLSNGDVLFSCGEEGKSLFILEEGQIKITGETGKHVLNINQGQITGEHSVIMKQPRNTTATCASGECKLLEVKAKDFYKLYNSSPSMKEALREVCLRRDFQKAVAKRFGSDFGTSMEELRKAFDASDLDGSGEIGLEDVKELLKTIYPDLADDDPLFAEVLHTLDIDDSNSVSWEEFFKVFS